MKIILLAVGTKMPGWVQEGFNDYQKRFPSEMKLVLEEIPPVKRNGKGSEEKAKELEAKLILEALPKKAYIIALDERGKQYTSLEMGQKVGSWQSLGIIGCALCKNPKILILDEPTSGLDGRNMRKIKQILLDYSKKGHCVVVITHDLELIDEDYFDAIEIKNQE